MGTTIEGERLSSRGRRAVALIALAITLIVVASLLYLYANGPRPAKFIYPPPSVAVLPGRFSASYDFVSPSLGWALVADRQGAFPQFSVFRTTDGARRWQKQFSGAYRTSNELAIQMAIQFFDRTHGMISAGDLYRTSDGGAHWQPVPVPNQTVRLRFADPTRGWVLTWSYPLGRVDSLFATADGGLTWNPRSWPADAVWGSKGGLGDVHFRANGEGWVGSFGAQPTVYSTFDGGATWEAHPIELPPGLLPTPSPVAKPYPPPGFPGFTVDTVLLPRAGMLALVSDDFGQQRALTSFDRGATWRPITSLPGTTTIGDFLFLDANHWWAMRFGFLYKTSDAGQSWKEVHVSPLLENWNYVPNVIDAKHAWAQMISTVRAPQDTALAMTPDGGVTWATVNVPKPG